MKEYDRPMMSEMNIITEGVYAGSGTPDIPDIPDDPPSDGSWTVNTEYTSHNSGSHSEVRLNASYSGSTSGDVLILNFAVTGFTLYDVKDSSQYSVSNVSENGFTIRLDGHFNPGHNYGPVIQIRCKKGDNKIGAVGVTGVSMPCTIKCSSYTYY